RDKIPGTFRGLNSGDTRGSENVTLVVAAVDNHRQGFWQHGYESLGVRFAHRFGLGGYIHHMRFASGVNVGQLRHSLFLQMRMKITRTSAGIQLRSDDVLPRGAAGFG